MSFCALDDVTGILTVDGTAHADRISFMREDGWLLRVNVNHKSIAYAVDVIKGIEINAGSQLSVTLGRHGSQSGRCEDRLEPILASSPPSVLPPPLPPLLASALLLSEAVTRGQGA